MLSGTPPRDPSRGAILMLALCFLLMMALVSATVVRTVIVQLRMAGNDQFAEEALQQAQAIAMELASHPDHFQLDAPVGHANCLADHPAPACDSSTLRVPASASVPPGVVLDARVIRRAPLLWRGFPYRESQMAASGNRFDAAMFEIDVRIDGSAVRLGSTQLVQGIAVRVPAIRHHGE